MAFNISNDTQRNDAYDYIKGRIGGFYGSSMYSDYWTRCENRIRAYYMRAASTAPVWKSKLYFATYFLGIQALDSAMSSSLRQDPITTVSLADGLYSPAAKEKAQLAQWDINHDLYIGRFRDSLQQISWYMRVFGTGVGREYVASDVEEKNIKQMVEDQFGIANVTEIQDVQRKEHTKTDPVHPLNFSHDMTVSDFWQSRWASVRYPLPIGDIYKMKGDERYYQPGVKELLDKITNTKTMPTWSSGKDTFYSENESSEQYKNSVIVDEYSGDLNFQGNYDDNTLYHCLVVKQYNIVLRMSKSPFRRHNYWKIRAYPDPHGPYGVDPCAPLLPVNLLKNSTINQYIDHMNASLKFMYETYDGNIQGGIMSLIEGRPNGVIQAIDEESYLRGPMVRAVQKDKQGISGVADMISYIERYEQQAGPSSNLRGKPNEQLNATATGIGLMAQREDAEIGRMMDKIDAGLVDAMHMKMDLRTQYMTQPLQGEIQKGSPPVRYFPWELAGVDYKHKIRRVTPEIEAGKYLSYLKLAGEFMESGVVNMAGVAKLLKIVGQYVGIDEIDEIVQEPMPPMINTGADPAQMAAMGGQIPPDLPPISGADKGAMPQPMEIPQDALAA